MELGLIKCYEAKNQRKKNSNRPCNIYDKKLIKPLYPTFYWNTGWMFSFKVQHSKWKYKLSLDE